MIEPPPLLSIMLKACLAPKKMPFKLTAMKIRSHSLSSTSTTGFTRLLPALLNRISRRPNLFSTSSIALRQSASLATSPGMKKHAGSDRRSTPRSHALHFLQRRPPQRQRPLGQIVFPRLDLSPLSRPLPLLSYSSAASYFLLSLPPPSMALPLPVHRSLIADDSSPASPALSQPPSFHPQQAFHVVDALLHIILP